MAGHRRRSREAALQLLYQLEITDDDSAASLELFWQGRQEDPARPEIREYAERLVRGVRARQELLDGRIAEVSENWDPQRMSRVDRNILRLGLWELMEAPEVPGEVILDEAVDLAREFSDDGSARFINGILDRLARTEGRVGRVRNDGTS
jgi:N utilization substance protein B